MKFSARPPHLIQRLGLALVMFLCSAFAANAWADPPGRVGRVGEVSGQVWLYTPDAGEWIGAVRNRPLSSGDRLATDADARAELRVGSSTIRLDAGTELEVLRIDDDHISLQLHNGSVAARLRSAESAREFDLVTAEGRFITNRPGRYRFDRADDSSNVTVWSGEALYEGQGSALTVNPGQRAEFWLDRNNAAQYSITEPTRDDFTAWSDDRDRRDDRSASTRYVSPEMTGVEDLDRYGRWEQASDYGAVWVPRQVPVGWAPYSAGHWAWVSPWGWTWVDDAPWGFAPFHYGRWAMWHDRWCWVPGTYVRRPVYAPALVAWVGGPHVSLSISIGNRPAPAVGWFPLAPREVYVPTYRVSPHYVQQVNITHVTNITNITTIVNNPQQAVTNVDYRNRRFPHAVTVVPQAVMVNRQAVAPSAALIRNTPAVQQLVNQPTQKFVVSAPPVATPVITPAVAQARRMQTHDIRGNEPGRTGVVASNPSPAPAAALVVPAPPTRNGVASRFADPAQQARPTQERERRHDVKEEQRQPATVAVPSRVAPAAARAEVAPAQTQPDRVVPPAPGRAHAPPNAALPVEPMRPPVAARPAVPATPAVALPSPARVERVTPPVPTRSVPPPPGAQRAAAEAPPRTAEREAPPPPPVRWRNERVPPASGAQQAAETRVHPVQQVAPPPPAVRAQALPVPRPLPPVEQKAVPGQQRVPQEQQAVPVRRDEASASSVPERPHGRKQRERND